MVHTAFCIQKSPYQLLQKMLPVPGPNNGTPTAEISSRLLGANRHRSTESPALTSKTAAHLWLYPCHFPALFCKSRGACGLGEGAGVKKKGVSSSGQSRELEVLLEYKHMDSEKGLGAAGTSVCH